MQVKKRLRVNTLVMVITTLVIVLVLLFSLHRTNKANDAAKIAGGITANTLERITLRSDYMRNNTARAREQWFSRHDQIGRLLKSASKEFTTSDDRETIGEMQADHESVRRLFSAIVENRNRRETRGETNGLVRETEERLLSQLDMRVYDEILHGRALLESSRKARSSALSMAGGGIILVLAIMVSAAVFNSWGMGRAITDRVRRLRDGAAKIGGGDLEYRIDVKGDDEFAELSDAFNGMTAQLGGSYRDLEKEIGERRRAEELLQRSHDDLEMRIRERTKELQKTGDALKAERQRLYDVLETLPVYVILLTKDYHVPFANRFFRERFGESGGKRCYEYLFGRTEPCEICETYNVMKTNAPHHWEWTGPDERNYDIYDYPFVDSDGSTMILEMGIDITGRKEVEQALKDLSVSQEQRIVERTAELQLANATLRDSRKAVLNIMEDALVARRQAEQASDELRLEVTERKQAEQALQESEEKYRSLFQNQLDAFCYVQMVFDENDSPIDYVYREVNDAFAEMSGFDNVVGRKVSEVTPGVREAHPEMFEAYGRVAMTGRPEKFEIHFTPTDRWFTVSAYSIRKGYVAIVFDNITERKVRENRIASLTQLYAVLSRVNETIVRTRDEESLFSEVCRTVADQGGFPLVWIGLAKGTEVVPAAFCGPNADYLREIKVEVQGNLGQGPTGTCIREDRSVINDDFGTNPATSPWKEPAARHGFHASAAFPLRRQGKAIGALTLYANDPGAFDAEQVGLLESLSADISYALDAMEQEQLRVRSEEALKKAHDELEQRVEKRTEELQQAYTQLMEETKEREVIEEQLRQAHKMEAIGTLAGGIAHDFNNILAAIIGFAEVLHGRVPANSAEKHHANRILEAGLRGRELVQRMLTFSRKTEQQKKPLQLTIVVRETMKLLRASTPTTISMRINTGDDSSPVYADHVQMQQVLMNLCTNAAQAMQEKGGVLDVTLTSIEIPEDDGKQGMKPGAYVKLLVSDSGVGMSPSVVTRIFDPFFTTKGPGEGSGLGLSVVHGIISQHEGYIEVESEPGVGTTFTVYIPKMPDVPSPLAATEQEVPTGTERVLLVDDEEMLAEMGQEILEDLGYRVTSRTSSTEAMELFRSDPSQFDLIITDQTMPDMTGVEFAGEILTIRPDMPVILCTGFSHIANTDSAKATGIRAFVMKPLTKREIAKTIRDALDHE